MPFSPPDAADVWQHKQNSQVQPVRDAAESRLKKRPAPLNIPQHKSGASVTIVTVPKASPVEAKTSQSFETALKRQPITETREEQPGAARKPLPEPETKPEYSEVAPKPPPNTDEQAEAFEAGPKPPPKPETKEYSSAPAAELSWKRFKMSSSEVMEPKVRRNVWASWVRDGKDRSHITPLSTKEFGIRVAQLLLATVFLIITAFSAFNLNMGNVSRGLASAVYVPYQKLTFHLLAVHRIQSFILRLFTHGHLLRPIWCCGAEVSNSVPLDSAYVSATSSVKPLSLSRAINTAFSGHRRISC
jgi:hypothetical protein